jgi:hypothetical protein
MQEQIHVCTWHGSREEYARLCQAIDQNCTCSIPDPAGCIIDCCSAHALLDDQRMLDHLLFVYRSKQCFRAAEAQGR